MLYLAFLKLFFFSSSFWPFSFVLGFIFMFQLFSLSVNTCRRVQCSRSFYNVPELWEKINNFSCKFDPKSQNREICCHMIHVTLFFQVHLPAKISKPYHTTTYHGRDGGRRWFSNSGFLGRSIQPYSPWLWSGNCVYCSLCLSNHNQIACSGLSTDHAHRLLNR